VVSANGTVTLTPSAGPYVYQQTVTMAATASAGYTFTGWTVTGDGASVSSDGTTLTIGPADVTLTANYTPNTYTLTTAASPPAGGTVSVSGGPSYNYGDVVTISQTPAAGYTFAGWTATGGTVSTDGTQLTITDNATLTADYTQNSYTASEQYTGGTVQLTSSGPYTYGQVVGLSAAPDAGWQFLGWSVTGASTLSDSTAATTSLTVLDNFILTANFSALSYNLTGVASPTAGGTVDVSSATGTIGQAVSLSQTPQTGYTFTGWTVTDGGNGAALNSDSTAVILGSADVTVTANYSQTPYTVTVTQVPGGTVAVSPSQATYTYGSTATVTATAQTGYQLAGWVVTGGTVAPSTSPATLTVQGDVALSASFTQETFTVTATTLSNWVYQNTPVTTIDRHYLALTTHVTANTWGNTRYTATVWQSGPGVVRPSTTIVNSSGVGSVTDATSFGFTGTSGTWYLVGGRVLGGGVVGSTANLAVTGSCTVAVSVVGDVSGPANPATASVTLFVRRLGDVDGNAKVQAADKNDITQKIAGTPVAGVDPAAYDIDGNNKIQAADKNIITNIIAGVVIP
jgi:uncharacterized repeat protein (TIGR02543 family)